MTKAHEQESGLAGKMKRSRQRQGTALLACCLLFSLLMPFRIVYCSAACGYVGIRASSLGRCCCCASHVSKTKVCQTRKAASREAPVKMQESDSPCCPSCVEVVLPLAAGMKALDNARHSSHLKAPCVSSSVPCAGDPCSSQMHDTLHLPLAPACPDIVERLSTTILLI
jgi:hypothetical protein